MIANILIVDDEEGGVGLGNVGWSEIDTVGEGAFDGAEDALGGLDGFGCEM